MQKINFILFIVFILFYLLAYPFNAFDDRGSAEAIEVLIFTIPVIFLVITVLSILRIILEIFQYYLNRKESNKFIIYALLVIFPISVILVFLYHYYMDYMVNKDIKKFLNLFINSVSSRKENLFLKLSFYWAIFMAFLAYGADFFKLRQTVLSNYRLIDFVRQNSFLIFVTKLLYFVPIFTPKLNTIIVDITKSIKIPYPNKTPVINLFILLLS